MLLNEQDVINYVQSDDVMMDALRTAKSANLPGWYIGAGFIRDTVWNIQHGFEVDHNFKDLDLGYFDDKNISEKYDEDISEKLKKILPFNWEVVNQAYAHKYNNVPPYKSAEDGLAHWVETATSVALTLDDNDKVKIIAPWGLDDLLNLKLRLVPCHLGNKYYDEIFAKRIQDKRWLTRWPKLQVISLSLPTAVS